MNVFVFDIETVPDVAYGRRLLELEGLSDKEIADAMFSARRQEKPNSLLKLPAQRIVAISALLKSNQGLKIWTLGDESSDEAEILQRFFQGIERYQPTLVTYNGGGFDLPVIHYRALKHGISAPLYWDMGQKDPSNKWNNYINRYHLKHLDLMELMSLYQARASCTLTEIATLIGAPGKMGMDGSKVWGAYLDGDLKAIRDYCESDVMNTYLVYLRFELMRGVLNKESYLNYYEEFVQLIKNSPHDHWREFSDALLEMDPVG